MNKNFMYGIGAVKYKDFTIGYIEKTDSPKCISHYIRRIHATTISMAE